MKILGRIALIVVAIIVVGAIGLLGYRGWLQHRVAGELRLTEPNHIDEARFVEINGRQEWITISGEDHSKPIILFLNGGPSEANSEFARLFQPFEHDYVFVQWDQPGAGKPAARIIGFGIAGKVWPDRDDVAGRDGDIDEPFIWRGDPSDVFDQQVHACP